MSGLAMIMSARGYRITGSDANDSDTINKLRSCGITVYIGHDAGNLMSSCALVVYTVAVSQDNPELIKANQLGIPVVERGVFLGLLTKEHKYSVAVSGTHGKTTTTAMVSSILIAQGFDPAVHLGSTFDRIGGSVRMSYSDYFVTEACEYHSNFLHLSPYCGIILNVEPEHMDWFGTYDNVLSAYTEFASNVDENGAVVVCSDWKDAVLCAMEGSRAPVVTYSLRGGCGIVGKHHFSAENIVSDENGSTFDITLDGHFYHSVQLKVPGLHNISNALAACAAAYSLSCSPESIAAGLLDFKGTGRRFELIGRLNGAPVIDDYAHHPTEVAATLSTARLSSKGRIFGVFQPHTYSRAISFLEKFGEAFRGCDNIIVTDIYAAREVDHGDINSKIISDYFTECGLNSQYMKDFTDIAIYLKQNVRKDDIVVILGAGDVNKICKMVTAM